MRMSDLWPEFMSCLSIRRASWPEGIRVQLVDPQLGITTPTGAYLHDGVASAPYFGTFEDFTASDWELLPVEAYSVVEDQMVIDPPKPRRGILSRLFV